MRNNHFVIFFTVLLIVFSSCNKDQKTERSAEIYYGPESWPVFRGNYQLNGFVDAHLSAGPEVLWSFQAEAAFISTPVSDGNSLFLTDIEGNIYSLDLTNGAVNWMISISNSFESSPLVSGSTLICITLDGRIMAINKKNGNIIWENTLEGRIISSPVALPGKDIYLGSYDSHMYALSPDDGQIVWKYKTGSYINGSVSLIDEMLYFGGCDGVIRCVNTEGIDIFSIDRESYMPGSPAAVGNSIYSAHYDGSISAISTDESRIIWSVNPGEKESFSSTPAADNQNVYIGGKSGRFFAFNGETGKQIWTFLSGGSIESGAMITENQVWFGSADHYVYCLDKESGELLFSYDTGAPVTAGVIAVRGKVAAAADSGLVLVWGKTVRKEKSSK